MGLLSSDSCRINPIKVPQPKWGGLPTHGLGAAYMVESTVLAGHGVPKSPKRPWAESLIVCTQTHFHNRLIIESPQAAIRSLTFTVPTNLPDSLSTLNSILQSRNNAHVD